MEIYLYVVMIRADGIHIKRVDPQIPQKNLSEVGAIIRIGALFLKNLAMRLTAAFDGTANNGFGIDTGLYHFIINKAHPRGPVFDLGAIDFRRFCCFISRVFNNRHVLPL
jgi:hypothetical protein